MVGNIPSIKIKNKNFQSQFLHCCKLTRNITLQWRMLNLLQVPYTTWHLRDPPSFWSLVVVVARNRFLPALSETNVPKVKFIP